MPRPKAPVHGSASFGDDPVSRDNVMPLARAFDTHMIAEKMVLPTECHQTPLAAIGHA